MRLTAGQRGQRLAQGQAAEPRAGQPAQVGVDDAGAVAVGASALRIGAEQRRLYAVSLGERVGDGVEQPGVCGRVAATRAADGRLVDGDDVRPLRHRAVDRRTLARTGHPASTVPS